MKECRTRVKKIIGGNLKGKNTAQAYPNGFLNLDILKKNGWGELVRGFQPPKFENSIFIGAGVTSRSPKASNNIAPGASRGMRDGISVAEGDGQGSSMVSGQCSLIDEAIVDWFFSALTARSAVECASMALFIGQWSLSNAQCFARRWRSGY